MQPPPFREQPFIESFLAQRHAIHQGALVEARGFVQRIEILSRRACLEIKRIHRDAAQRECHPITRREQPIFPAERGAD